MTPRDTPLFVANDNQRPSRRRHVGACFILALGVANLIFESIVAFRYIF